MLFQMGLDLFFGFGHETQIARHAGVARQHAQGKRTRVPDRVQQAGPAVQFRQSLVAPDQMIHFLGGGVQ
ncbi:hypothetical protein D3C77_604810 [compost metagenome]